METIINWFTEVKEQNPEQTKLIDRIIDGINTDGFNPDTLNQWITKTIHEIETSYQAELKEDYNAQN